MDSLAGMYECKADSKGRILLPVGLKKQIEEFKKGLILKRSIFNQCLEIHTLDKWGKTMKEINNLNRFIKENNDFIRLFTSGVRLVKSDKMSRIQIPKDLINFASINKDVILAAVGDIIEIWDKKQYEILIKNQSINFSNMAESVMGKITRKDEK